MPQLTSSLAEDPAYLAFLRAMGVQEALLREEIARRTGMLEREAAYRLPRFQEAESEGLQRIAGSYENRGLFRSGDRLMAQARYQRDIGYRRADFLRSIENQRAALANQLALGIANLRRREAESALSAAGRLALEGADMAYPPTASLPPAPPAAPLPLRASPRTSPGARGKIGRGAY